MANADQELPAEGLPNGVTSVKADYEDEARLASALNGVHTLLCFITSQSDPGSVAQKTLINAAVKAGVKRYAPSEWASWVPPLFDLPHLWTKDV